jgi:hypothetical protein
MRGIGDGIGGEVATGDLCHESAGEVSGRGGKAGVGVKAGVATGDLCPESAGQEGGPWRKADAGGKGEGYCHGVGETEGER